MSTTTKNYALTKPGTDDAVDIGVLNENFDKIDEQMKKSEEAIPPVATTESAGIVKPDGTTIVVDEDGTVHGAQTYELPMATPTVLGGVKIGKNLTMDENGTINAYVAFPTDDAPIAGSNNVPLSGGTYKAIDDVDQKVNSISSQVTALTTGVKWKAAVETFDSIATTYPAPEIGWTVNCLDTGKTYQWDGAAWNLIFASVIPIASVADVLAVLEG